MRFQPRKTAKQIIAISMITFLCACSESNNEALYNGCIEIGMKEQMEGMSESDRPSVRHGVQQGCKTVTRECTDNPDGEMCKAFKLKFIN